MDAARQQGHQIVRDDGAGLHREVGAEALGSQGNRMEVCGLGPGLLGLEIETGPAEQVDGLIPLDPALQQGMGLARRRADHVELRGGVGILHRGPAIGGRRGLVHDQHAHGPLAGCLLVLVGPAAVIGHGLAFEPTGGGMSRRGLEIRIIDQDDRDLALEVHALEIIPVPLRGLDAIADEDEGRPGDVHPLDRQQGMDHRLVALMHDPGPVLVGKGQLRRGADLEAAQGRVLGPGALAVGAQVTAGGQAQRLELAGDIVEGLHLRRRRRAATFEGVARQDLHVGRQPGGVHRCRRQGLGVGRAVGGSAQHRVEAGTYQQTDGRDGGDRPFHGSQLPGHRQGESIDHLSARRRLSRVALSPGGHGRKTRFRSATKWVMTLPTPPGRKAGRRCFWPGVSPVRQADQEMRGYD